MAKQYIDNINTEATNKFASTGTPYVNPFKRMGAFPLDRTELFDSLEDAKKYAKGENDKRSLSGTSYPGQIISVVSNGSVIPYQIQSDGSLKSLLSDADTVLSNPWETYEN